MNSNLPTSAKTAWGLIFERASVYARLTRLDKPIGILLLLWPTLWGVWLASRGQPRQDVLWVFILGTVLMRSAGCVINDLADRKFDPHVERTRLRPLACGEASVREALILFGVLVGLAFALVLSLRNVQLIGLSCMALLLAASYPFTKRFFAIPQAYLGIAFGFGIPMAFLAQTGSVPSLAWTLLVANVFWAIAYDTEYAMVDREDDLKIGIKTSAITFGSFDVQAIMGCYTVTVALLMVAGLENRFGTPYFIGVTVASAIALYHYTLIRNRDPALCFKAFLHNNWFGAAIFVGIVLDSTLGRALRDARF